jgi:hypothetical protein
MKESELKARPDSLLVSGDKTFFTLQGEGESLGEDDILKSLPINDVELEGYLEMSNFNPEDLYKERDLQIDTSNIRGMTVIFTQAQSEVIKQAVDKLKGNVENYDIDTPRALELICADYIAGR